MAGGGFGTGTGGGDFEAKITPLVIISCILASSGGLMFGYDVGISGTYVCSKEIASYVLMHACMQMVIYLKHK